MDELNEDQRAAYEMLLKLSDDERLGVFSMFCTSCGCDDPRCQCWNDE